MIETRSGQPAAPTKAYVTYEEFLARTDEDAHVEWVDGEVVEMSPVSRRHQIVGGFLLELLRVFTRLHRLGEIQFEPFQMKTGPDLPGRSPDIMFIAREHLDRLKETYLDGPADLVVEVVSPESRSRDRGEKFDEYERGGVREYWIIDPERKRADFHVLDEEGAFRAVALDASGEYRSHVLPGLALRPEWLWMPEPPDPNTVLPKD